MLQWEIDRSLTELTNLYGFERAANIYRQSLQAVTGLKALVEAEKLPCDFRPRQSLYLASGDESAIAVFKRDAATGALHQVDVEQEGGQDFGLAGTHSVMVSPDGLNVYATHLPSFESVDP